MQASLFVLAPIEAVRSRVQSAYPDSILRQDMTVHFVNRDANEDEVMALFVSPSMSRPGESLVQINSRLAYDAMR